MKSPTEKPNAGIIMMVHVHAWEAVPVMMYVRLRCGVVFEICCLIGQHLANGLRPYLSVLRPPPPAVLSVQGCPMGEGLRKFGKFFVHVSHYARETLLHSGKDFTVPELSSAAPLVNFTTSTSTFGLLPRDTTPLEH